MEERSFQPTGQVLLCIFRAFIRSSFNTPLLGPRVWQCWAAETIESGADSLGVSHWRAALFEVGKAARGGPMGRDAWPQTQGTFKAQSHGHGDASDAQTWYCHSNLYLL